MTIETRVRKFESTELFAIKREMKRVVIRRVLIIDDDEDIREVAQLALETVGGWQVFTAQSGAEGFYQAEVQQPDVILLDMMMPDMDGLSTLALIRSNPLTVNIPVVIVTAKAQTVDKNRCAQLGVTTIIAKPFDPMALSYQVAQALGWE